MNQMKSINALTIIITWVIGHFLVCNVQHYLTATYFYNVPFISLVFIAAIYIHSRIFMHMAFKVLDYI
jgi:hypothetical protein